MIEWQAIIKSFKYRGMLLALLLMFVAGPAIAAACEGIVPGHHNMQTSMPEADHSDNHNSHKGMNHNEQGQISCCESITAKLIEPSITVRPAELVQPDAVTTIIQPIPFLMNFVFSSYYPPLSISGGTPVSRNILLRI